MSRVAIHQVNFFPWLPFFHKIAAVDHFILLDDVQYERTGAGSWQNRVRLAFQGDPYWLTCPLDRSGSSGTAKINEMQIQPDARWRNKAVNTLSLHYKKSLYFNEVFPLVEGLLQQDTSNLAEFNENAIRAICRLIGLQADIVRSSELAVDTSGTQRLIDLVQAVGGETYYSGRNAADTYQDNDTFAAQGVALDIESFSVPAYEQLKTSEFVDGLSVLDALFNVGPQMTRELIS